MARRSAIGDALAGFSDAYDQVGKIAQNVELSKLGREQATDSVDPETGIKTTSFLGKQYEGGLSPEAMDSARTQRMTEIVGKYDPMRGMEMRRSIARDKREEKAFDLNQRTGEQSLKGMQQQSKLTDYKIDEAGDNAKLKEGRRAFAKQLQGMKPDELADYIGNSFNEDGNTPAMIAYDKKSNRFMLTSKIPGIPSQSFSRAELMQQATALWEQGNGDFHTGLGMQVQILKDQHQKQREVAGDAKDVAHGNFQAAWKEKEYGLHAAGLQLQRDRLQDERSRAFGTQVGYTVGPDGQLQPGLIGMRLNGRTGAMEGFGLNMADKLPGGFIPEGAVQAAQKNAMALVGQPTGRLNADRSQELHTLESAGQLGSQNMIRAYTGKGGNGNGLDPSVLAKMPGFLAPAAPQQQAPAQAAQAPAAPQQQGIRAGFGSQGLRFGQSGSQATGPQIVIQNGRPVPVMAGPQQMSEEDAMRYLYGR